MRRPSKVANDETAEYFLRTADVIESRCCISRVGHAAVAFSAVAAEA
jgi:hypothetical protein